MHTIDIRMLLSRQAVLLAITSLNESGKAFTVQEIADLAQCGEATVYRAIVDLEKAGRLRVTPGRGRGVCSTYEVIEGINNATVHLAGQTS